MHLKGKISVAILGLVLGGLTGVPRAAFWAMLLGALIGHFGIDRKTVAAEERQFRNYQRQRGRYLFHVFSLLAKLAKADGPVNEAEVRLVNRIMREQFRLNDRSRQQAIEIWNKAKNSPRPMQDFAHDFFQEFGKERHKVLETMHLLFDLAGADGALNRMEEGAMLQVAGIFHISRSQFQRIRARFFHVPEQPQAGWSAHDPHFLILGAEPHESLESIKKKYRELAKKWHPDRLVAAGATPDAVRHAKEKFQQINEAWERVSELKK